jgi:hypothetical protein
MSDRYYLGTRGPAGFREVTVHDGDRAWRLDWPRPLEWGHAGCSRELADAVLCDYYDGGVAIELGGRFNRDVVERLGVNLFTLTAEQIDRWVLSTALAEA